MKSVIYILSSLMLVLNSSFICHNEIVLSIDFQDFFDGDTVSLQVEECEIFSDQELTSDGSLGLVDLEIHIARKSPTQILIIYNEARKTCTHDVGERIVLRLVLNGQVDFFKVNPRKGRYVGFEKRRNRIVMRQSKRPFEYD